MPLFKPKSKSSADPPKIRVEKVAVAPPKQKPKPSSSSLKSLPSPSRGSSSSPRPSTSRALAALQHKKHQKGSSPFPSSSRLSADERRLAERKRKNPGAAAAAAARPSPASDRVEFGDESDEDGDDDDDWVGALEKRKRQRRGVGDGRFVDENRALRCVEAFEDGEGRSAGFIHAEEVASLSLGCVPVLAAQPDDVVIELQYPSLLPRERYELVWGKDKIDAVGETVVVVRHIADTYLSDDEAEPFTNANSGLIRQLEKASNRNVQDLQAFKTALGDYNDKILGLVRDGTVARNLDARHELPRNLVAFILSQVYDRTVAPKVELLSKYENGTDNVYGELLHPFVSQILVERVKMTSDQVFVDLGSGVGNVVIQAALEIGCESWGCEMMENACNLAEAQQREFVARCRLWGIAPGKVSLERGDFRKNAAVHEVLQRADVVLVNNQAFTSQLNDDLVRMFLDLKSGCKVISLKSFVHDHKSAAYNINDVGNTILDVEELTYPQGYVSWTNAGGTYCISTRK